MKSLSASKKSVHLSSIDPHVVNLLTAAPDHGLLHPVEKEASAINPRFNEMDLWDTFLYLHSKGEVCDLGFSLSDLAQGEEGYYMARSKYLPRLSSQDPLYAVIANLENQWRVKWLRELMGFLDSYVLDDTDEEEFAAHDLASHLWKHAPSLIPQKSWRSRGCDITRIENELAELFMFHPVVTHDPITFGVRFGFARRPVGRGFTRCRLFGCCRDGRA